MIGSFFQSGFWRIFCGRRQAVHHRHHDVHQDEVDRVALLAEGFLDRLDRLAAVSRNLHPRAARFENACQGINVPDVILDHQNSPPFEQRIAIARPADHPLLFVRKVGNDLMQEQADFIEKPLG